MDNILAKDQVVLKKPVSNKMMVKRKLMNTSFSMSKSLMPKENFTKEVNLKGIGIKFSGKDLMPFIKERKKSQNITIAKV